jgi:RNA polymerase sigma-70 factor (ECF subfamily)
MKSYLYQATKNRSLKHIAHMNVRAKHTKDVLMVESVEVDESGEMETGEIYEIVEKALHELPERCSEIFRLSRSKGMKYEEIAKHLSISVKTVEANMGKALKHLRDNVQAYYKTENKIQS